MPPHNTSHRPTAANLPLGNEVVPACTGRVNASALRALHLARGQAGATLYAALQAATLVVGAKAVTQSCVPPGARARHGTVLGVEIWQLPPGHLETRRHAALNAKANWWRNWRSGGG